MEKVEGASLRRTRLDETSNMLSKASVRLLKLSEMNKRACFEVEAFYNGELAHSPRSRSEDLNTVKTVMASNLHKALTLT